MYGDIGESDLSAESTSKAYKLRGRVSDRENFFISAAYDLQVTGNMERTQQACELWARAYPRDAMPHAFLSGEVNPSPPTMKRQSRSPTERSRWIQAL
jgi:hypothetical protein